MSKNITPMAAARKAKELRDYFDCCGRIHLVIDATRDDVEVPPHLKGNPGLCLLLSTRMPQIIEINKDGVQSAFSFAGNPFSCVIPIGAIWAAYQPKSSLEEGLIWQDDVPPAVQQVMASMIPKPDQKEEPPEPAPPVVPTSKGRSKGHLRIV
ncbi:MAG: hypothetical protein R8J85_02525 [Mariprofundales bacterium]